MPLHEICMLKHVNVEKFLSSIKIQESHAQYDDNLTRNISSSVTAKIRSSLPVNRFISFWTAFVSIRTYRNYSQETLFLTVQTALKKIFTSAQAAYTEKVLSVFNETQNATT